MCFAESENAPVQLQGFFVDLEDGVRRTLIPVARILQLGDLIDVGRMRDSWTDSYQRNTQSPRRGC